MLHFKETSFEADNNRGKSNIILSQATEYKASDQFIVITSTHY
jgi:hypothetical protein